MPLVQEPVAWAYVNTDAECEQIEWGDQPDDPSIILLYARPVPVLEENARLRATLDRLKSYEAVEVAAQAIYDRVGYAVNWEGEANAALTAARKMEDKQ